MANLPDPASETKQSEVINSLQREAQLIEREATSLPDAQAICYRDYARHLRMMISLERSKVSENIQS
jgi:hypothetical protein